MCIGGPALIYYVTPTEEQLFLVCPAGLAYTRSLNAIITNQKRGRNTTPSSRSAP